jgi:succinate dehydrogenase / fumarate reductase cytochrome b subunit
MTTATESVAPAVRFSRLGALWRSSIGKKALMAVTGVLLFLFTVGHMAGNLQVLKGDGGEAINHYAEVLRTSMPLLWTIRGVLLVALLVHAIAGIQLWLERQKARPIGYQDLRPVVSTPASRTMIWSGLLILGFVIFHLLDLTVGVIHPEFEHGQVYANILRSLGSVVGAGIYVVSMIALGFHLWHGLWSVFQSLGFSNRGLSAGIQKFAIAASVLLTLGFAAVPLAVLVGIVQ